ncbi:MAG: co-chaperone DjlA [Gammaproteobacteria bacterium]|nr:co-chaperone DjlA [Gammaproteobacteria bacterium]
MAWIGKVGGGILGLIVGGPVGALIGSALGHQFDRGAGGDLLAGLGGPGDDSSAATWSAADRQRLFFRTTFQGLGALAKADGRVSEAEIDAARALMAELRLPEATVREAIGWFTEGKHPEFPLRERVLVLRRACRGEPELLRTFIEIQMDFLLGKPAITSAERALLLIMTDALGVGRMDLARLEAILRARRSFRQQRPGAAPARTLDGAYRALGLDTSATDADVKTAYRRLMNQHHPDKQAARGLPDSLLESAKERTHEIRAAYELIREARGMK